MLCKKKNDITQKRRSFCWTRLKRSESVKWAELPITNHKSQKFPEFVHSVLIYTHKYDIIWGWSSKVRINQWCCKSNDGYDQPPSVCFHRCSSASSSSSSCFGVCVSEVKGSGRSALLVSFVILNPAAVVAPPPCTYVMLFRSAGIRVQTKASTVAPNPHRHGCFCSLNTLTFKWTLHNQPPPPLNKRLSERTTNSELHIQYYSM